MNYNEANKAAWEEAFAKHRQGYAEDPALRIKRGDLSILHDNARATLQEIGLEGKAVGQFCCNNGIVLKSLREFDCDISTCWPHLNHKGMPLSYNLVAQKDNS